MHYSVCHQLQPSIPGAVGPSYGAGMPGRTLGRLHQRWFAPTPVRMHEIMSLASLPLGSHQGGFDCQPAQVPHTSKENTKIGCKVSCVMSPRCSGRRGIPDKALGTTPGSAAGRHICSCRLACESFLNVAGFRTRARMKRV